MGLRGEDQDHAGMVVADLGEAMDHLTAVAGYRWGAVFDGEVPVVLADGTRSVVVMRFVTSRTSPRVELIEQLPGTPWVRSGDSGVHHLGYWSDDVAADSASLAAQGLPLEVADPGTTVGPGRRRRMLWAYHRGPVGPRIELLDRSLRSTGAAALGAGSRGSSALGPAHGAAPGPAPRATSGVPRLAP